MGRVMVKDEMRKLYNEGYGMIFRNILATGSETGCADR